MTYRQNTNKLNNLGLRKFIISIPILWETKHDFLSTHRNGFLDFCRRECVLIDSEQRMSGTSEAHVSHDSENQLTSTGHLRTECIVPTITFHYFRNPQFVTLCDKFQCKTDQQWEQNQLTNNCPHPWSLVVMFARVILLFSAPWRCWMLSHIPPHAPEQDPWSSKAHDASSFDSYATHNLYNKVTDFLSIL